MIINILFVPFGASLNSFQINTPHNAATRVGSADKVKTN